MADWWQWIISPWHTYLYEKEKDSVTDSTGEDPGDFFDSWDEAMDKLQEMKDAIADFFGGIAGWFADVFSWLEANWIYIAGGAVAIVVLYAWFMAGAPIPGNKR